MSFLAGEYRAMMKWHREEVDRLRALADEHASRIEELRNVLNGVNGDEDITTFMQDQTRDRRAA